MPPPLHRRLRMRQLELLSALGDTPSIHRAARSLGMSQPAASKMLIEVEQLLGVRLFERTRRGISPSASGCAVIARARRVVHVLDAAREEVQAIESGARMLLRVGTYPVAAPVLLPRALAWLREHDAGVHVHLQEGGSESLLDGLRQGLLDCVVGRVLDGNDTSGLEVKHLYDEPVCVAVRPGHPLARRRRIGGSAATDYPWVLPLPHAPLRLILASWFAGPGRRDPRCLLESGSFLTNLTVIQQTDALALFPYGLARHYADLGLIRLLPLDLKAMLPPVALLHRSGEPDSDALVAFWTALRAVGPPSSATRSKPNEARRS